MPPGSRRAGVWARLCLSSEYRLRPRQRIALRDRHAQHPVEGLRCRRLGADVPFAAGGIGADDRKIVAAVDPAMPGPDGKKERGPRPDLEDPPAGTAEREDRKSVVAGKSVSVREDQEVLRTIQKQTQWTLDTQSK